MKTPLSGDNRITWISGCCDGDLVVVDFHDSHGDGNEGDGLLTLSNSTSGLDLTYRLGAFADMTWKTFGPFCAPAGEHSLSFTSDANPDETTFQVRRAPSPSLCSHSLTYAPADRSLTRTA